MARRDSEEEKQATGEAQAAMDESTAGNASGTRYGLREPARVASEEFSGPIIGLVRDTLTGTLHATGTVATNAVHVVRDVLTGAVHATEEVGTEALGAVGTLGGGIVGTARDILAGGVGGLRHVLGSAMPARRGNGDAHAEHERDYEHLHGREARERRDTREEQQSSANP
jgi:hypothetical protein